MNYDHRYMKKAGPWVQDPEIGSLHQFEVQYNRGYRDGETGHYYDPHYAWTSEQKSHYKKGFEDAREYIHANPRSAAILRKWRRP